jgi:three-Cys-motif partner protein
MKKRKRQPGLPREALLFDLPEKQTDEIRVDRLKNPVWTGNKAKLIERYLYHFVLVTKHGAYIDGFAGPQRPDHPEMWAAKLVLESEPQWLRHFYLFDKSSRQIERLRELRSVQPTICGRTIQIYSGDFNAHLQTLLQKREIKETEATFCLLDQRTFECHWNTVTALARYKGAGHPKVELFYFLAASWLPRALSAIKNEELLRQWWGRDDASSLRRSGVDQIKEMIIERFGSELGYKSVMAWPIFDRRGSEFVVYYMIHATDHAEAPKLMARAYNEAVEPPAIAEQLSLGLMAAGQDETLHSLLR